MFLEPSGFFFTKRVVPLLVVQDTQSRLKCLLHAERILCVSTINGNREVTVIKKNENVCVCWCQMSAVRIRRHFRRACVSWTTSKRTTRLVKKSWWLEEHYYANFKAINYLAYWNYLFSSLYSFQWVFILLAFKSQVSIVPWGGGGRGWVFDSGHRHSIGLLACKTQVPVAHAHIH